MGIEKDLTGNRYGRLVAKEKVESPNKDGRTYWLFECDCGNSIIKRVDLISKSPFPSCGCWTKERKAELSRKEFCGRRKCMLVVIEDIQTDEGYSLFKCRCDCGNEVVMNSLEFRNRKSCGCLKSGWKIKDTKNMEKHGYRGHAAYTAWHNMIDRCENQNCKEYKYYGDRGIEVCKEWHNVRNFCNWADENGFQKGLTLERKDVNGNYEPSNCEWITRKEQAWNKRNTIYITYNGEKVSLAKLVNQLGLNMDVIRDRWYRGIRDNERLLYNGDLRDLRKVNK